MAEIPHPVDNVPRTEVGDEVAVLLSDPNVGDIVCEERPDGTYTVTPKPTRYRET